MEIAHKIATEGPPDLGDAWPNAPRAAAEVLKRGMARDPADRPRVGRRVRPRAGRGAEGRADEDRTDPPLRGRPRRSAEPRPLRVQRQLLRRLPLLAGGTAVTTRRRPHPRPRLRRGGKVNRSHGPAAGGRAPGPDPRDRADRARRGGDRRRGAVRREAAGSSQSADNPPAAPAKKKPVKPKKEPKAKKEKPKRAEEQAAAPSDDGTSYDPALGAQLNSQGYSLMNQGNYAAAIPVLQRAVKSFPPGTSDLNYAYALFNLGKSLRLARRYDEAISVLEQRLKIPNQTDTVQRGSRPSLSSKPGRAERPWRPMPSARPTRGA